MALKLKIWVLVVAYLANFASVQSTLFKFCDLTPSGVFVDPLIIPEEALSDSQRTFPAARVAQAVARDPARKAYLDVSRKAADLSRQAASARTANRTKRQVGAEFLADNKFKALCTPQEKRIRFSFNINGDFCHVIDDLRYYECADSQCDYFNPFPNYQSFRCEPDTYIYVTGQALCGDGLELETQVFYVPINCCCRQYNCNMKDKYNVPRLQ